MKKIIPLVAAMLCCAPALSAQGVEPGMKVRVTGADGTRTTGRAVSLGGDRVGVQEAGADSVMVLAPDHAVEVSRGRNRALWTGVGVLAGATAGVLITRAQESEPEDIGGLQRTADGLANTATGILVGGVLGFFLAPERWRRVTPARVGVQPSSGRIEIGLSFRR